MDVRPWSAVLQVVRILSKTENAWRGANYLFNRDLESRDILYPSKNEMYTLLCIQLSCHRNGAHKFDKKWTTSSYPDSVIVNCCLSSCLPSAAYALHARLLSFDNSLESVGMHCGKSPLSFCGLEALKKTLPVIDGRSNALACHLCFVAVPFFSNKDKDTTFGRKPPSL